MDARGPRDPGRARRLTVSPRGSARPRRGVAAGSLGGCSVGRRLRRRAPVRGAASSASPRRVASRSRRRRERLRARWRRASRRGLRGRRLLRLRRGGLGAAGSAGAAGFGAPPGFGFAPRASSRRGGLRRRGRRLRRGRLRRRRAWLRARPWVRRLRPRAWLAVGGRLLGAAGRRAGLRPVAPAAAVDGRRRLRAGRPWPSACASPVAGLRLARAVRPASGADAPGLGAPTASGGTGWRDGGVVLVARSSPRPPSLDGLAAEVGGGVDQFLR